MRQDVVYTMAKQALLSRERLTLYTDIPQDPLVEKFLCLLQQLTAPQADGQQLLSAYYRFIAAFLPVAAKISTEGKHAWQNYMIKLIMSGENIFSCQAEVNDLEKIPLPLRTLAHTDLAYLQALARIDGEALKNCVQEHTGAVAGPQELPSWEGLYLDKNREKRDEAGSHLMTAFQELQDWGEGLELLGNYYKANGVGIFGQHHAFRWVRKNGEGRLEGVRNPDTIELNRLYEYEREQAKIINNTEQFLAGYPANNVLLYGDRGTGKSSTVKALISMYGNRGLRLVEIQKQDLEDFPLVVSELAKRAQKFILFVDDLSFTDQEGQYRELKALLEGGLEVRPRNVLVYATSNRRHLVQENFADRKATGFDPENDDVRAMDTLEEKLSLADRFGITVTFMAPDQKRYLTIVEKMARERGISIPAEELRQRALKWEMSFNARSARTARQFVDYLEGQIALEGDRA